MEGSCSIKATKTYKRAKVFIYNFTLYSLTSLVTSFFFCYQISSLFPSIKNIVFPPLPSNIVISMDLFSLDAKCLFVVANIIIGFITMQEYYSNVGRSAPNSPPPSDIYDEYVARSRSSTFPKVKHYSPDSVSGKEEWKSDENTIAKSACDEKRKKETRVQKKSEIIQRGKPNRVHNLPKEELNKRVEAFIAKVNKQRLIEAKLVDHSRG